jgi:hypothetical protein
VEGLRANERIGRTVRQRDLFRIAGKGVNARHTLPKLIKHGRDRLDRYYLCAGGDEMLREFARTRA